MKRHSMVWGILISAVGSGAGCALDPSLAGDAGERETGEASQAVHGRFDVGIIPDGAVCPGSSDRVQIYMDCEDKDENTHSKGWVGAVTVDRNVTFVFCRVDGTQFHPLSSINDPKNYYALLKLGEECPPGSEEFSRYFDNEDSNNRSSSIGDIYPNTADENTNLRFCMFRFGEPSMADFPDLDGVPYGVFAAEGFSKAIASGWIYTDDEDKNNSNSYWASSPDAAEAARAIIKPGKNTVLGTAHVR